MHAARICMLHTPHHMLTASDGDCERSAEDDPPAAAGSAPALTYTAATAAAAAAGGSASASLKDTRLVRPGEPPFGGDGFCFGVSGVR
mmetsp:Transcript_7878/g.20433  ORF Transcript_7878/g.20433 Transcript_7878/m.20433 type:complete len:88 (-) Transcript_7878:889-1152(-)